MKTNTTASCNSHESIITPSSSGTNQHLFSQIILIIPRLYGLDAVILNNKLHLLNRIGKNVFEYLKLFRSSAKASGVFWHLCVSCDSPVGGGGGGSCNLSHKCKSNFSTFKCHITVLKCVKLGIQSVSSKGTEHKMYFNNIHKLLVHLHVMCINS